MAGTGLRFSVVMGWGVATCGEYGIEAGSAERPEGGREEMREPIPGYGRSKVLAPPTDGRCPDASAVAPEDHRTGSRSPARYECPATTGLPGVLRSPPSLRRG